MSRIDKLSLSDIIEHINVYFDNTNSARIWKDDVPLLIASQGKQELDDIEDIEGLNVFVHQYGLYIDNIKFLVASIESYHNKLNDSNTSKIERERLQQGLENAKRLLSDVNKTYAFFDEDEQTNMIVTVTVFNTQEMCKEISRKDRNDNVQRLAALEKEIDFENITQSILRADVQYVITTNTDVGTALRYKIEYNSLARQLQNNADRKKLRNVDIGELSQRQSHGIFVKEINQTIKDNIEELDFDKLLLTSARNYLEIAESRIMKEEETKLLKERLEIIKRHIKRQNIKVPSTEERKNYTTKELESDLKRFIVQGNKMRYLSKNDCEKIKSTLLEGRGSLNDLTVDIVEALDLKPSDISKLININVENYIFFLRQGKVIDSKEKTLKNIIKASHCSDDLLQLLCEKTDMTSEDVCDLFERGIISVTALKSVRKQVGTIITDEKLFAKYQDYKQNENSPEKAETARIQLERYALAYRNTELIGKTEDDIEEKGEEFITQVGENIQTSDLIPLYGLGIIPLKVAADWGGDKIIEQLLSSETLKPTDAKYLRDKGLLNEEKLEKLFKNNINMSYSYQIALVCTIFDGQTSKQQEIRERLAQYYNIENGIVNSSRKTTGNKNKNPRGEATEEVDRKIKMRDPGAKYNLLSSLDKDVRIEQGIVDGHIIFHYPNIGVGTVVIEKLHRITLNRENGLIEIRADNKSATYVLSEEEFIKMKPQLIHEGKVDRTELTQRWWETRDYEHWIPHLGIKGWEKAIKERFEINPENSRYSQDDLLKIEELIAKSIESKKGEDR